MATIFHIDADAFFASVEQGFNPLLRGKPVIVGGSEQQRGVVHTASYEARKQGVRTGMPLGEAKRICPEAVFLKGNFQHYQAASRMMQEIYLRYTPVVEFTSLDDAYLDFSGALHLYPPPAELAGLIQQEIRQALHISISIGIGPNKLLARIASGMKKPGGITEVPARKEKEFLEPLPVEEIPGVGRATKEKLSELGIFRVGQLAALPPLLLNELFGVNGLKFWNFANGIDEREIKPRILPKQISRETTFEEDLTDLTVITATFQYLAERIAAKLRHNGQRCRQVGMHLRYSDFTQHNLSCTLPYATASAAEIFSAVESMITRLALRRLRIRHVGIQVSRIEWNEWQLRFFDETKRWEILDAAVDDIRARYGFTAILPADSLSLQKHYRMDKSGFVLHSPALTR